MYPVLISSLNGLLIRLFLYNQLEIIGWRERRTPPCATTPFHTPPKAGQTRSKQNV